MSAKATMKEETDVVARGRSAARSPKAATDESSNTPLGYAAIVVTVLIWAGFAISIRSIGASKLSAADVAAIRFGLPSLLLLPFLPSRWSALRSVEIRAAFMLLFGGGVPFFLIASAGGRASSAAYVSALIAGTTPLAVALLSKALYGQVVGRRQWVSISIIMSGVAVLLVSQAIEANAMVLIGAGALLFASLLWAFYTLGLRSTGLDAIGNTLLLCIPSSLVIAAMLATGVMRSNLQAASFEDIFPFLIAQGLGVGVISSLSFATAIKNLGASRSASVGSLAPALASILAVPVLGESLTPAVIAGVLVITFGVYLTGRSGKWRR